MSLVYDRGLNCHLACLVSIAAVMGLPYRSTYATLWSETDFYYDEKYDLYLSGRLPKNLGALGLRVEVIDCATPRQTAEHLALLPNGTLFAAGMDTFHIPWSPVYRQFHGPHYFFARKEGGDTYCCYDPVYGIECVRVQWGEVFPCASELCVAEKTGGTPSNHHLADEAGDVLRGHPGLLLSLSCEIEACAGGERSGFPRLIKRMDAVVGNRHLFGRYLETQPPGHQCLRVDGGFLSRWEAVKNGLLKAAVQKDNRTVMTEVLALLRELMQDEVRMAEALIGEETGGL